MPRQRIMLVDDHEVVRLGLKALIDRRPNMEVVAEADSAAEGVTKALAFQPDAVVMDIRLGGGSGIDACREIVAQGRQPRSSCSPAKRRIVTFTADAEADQSLTSQARLALFHVAQEALSDAAKHSRASRVDAHLGNEAGTIVLSLTDNGRGFAPDQVEQRMGHGLMNMRDRASALGGQLSLRPAENGGTEVRKAIPKSTRAR